MKKVVTLFLLFAAMVSMFALPANAAERKTPSGIPHSDILLYPSAPACGTLADSTALKCSISGFTDK